MIYNPTSIISVDNTIIHLSHIESIGPDMSDEDRVVDNLSLDYKFTVTTVSGKTHIISCKDIILKILQPGEPLKVRQDAQYMYNLKISIVSRWNHLNTAKI